VKLYPRKTVAISLACSLISLGNVLAAGYDDFAASFALSGLTRVFEEKEYVHFDFEDRGRARIPFTAFPSTQDRADFIASFSTKEQLRT
jgi:hypothetical protein